MCQYPYGKNTGVSRVVQTGGKLTCRNSKTARNDSDELGLDPVVRVVSVLWSAPSSCRDRGTNRGSAPSSCRDRGANPSSCRYRWLKQGWKLSVATPWCNHSCRNSKTPPDSTRCSCVVTTEVQPRGVTTRVVTRRRRRTVRVVLAWLQPRSNPVVQPRAVTARVVIRGRTPPNRFNKMKGRRFI
jgi:hypothetical protein